MNEGQTDCELLRAFVRSEDQHAFAALARRHVDLVYGTAFRKVSDKGAAEEIAQNVFGSLARKAWQFAPDDLVPAWLHRAALLESRDWLRGELRRRRREQTAAELGTTMKTPDEEPALKALVPLLDEALLSLREKDRSAVLLRYWEARSLRDVGRALGVSEDTAQKRVAGALESITMFFRRRGFKTATGALAAAVLQHTASAAPASVATAVVHSAAAATPIAVPALIGFMLRAASLSKIQTAVLCTAIAAVPMLSQLNSYRTASMEARIAQQEHQQAWLLHSETLTEVERLYATAMELERKMQEAAKAANAVGNIQDALTSRRGLIHAALSAEDYRWPEDSPFVRIPKSVLPLINVNMPVTPAGILSRQAREFLGLTPDERQKMEQAMHSHIAEMDSLIEKTLYETNRYKYSIPVNAVARKIWAVPAQGEPATSLTSSLKSSFRENLGQERWRFVERALVSGGTDSLARVLNLQADQEQQAIAAWISKNAGNYTVSVGWAGANASFSSSGRTLRDYLPGNASQTDVPELGLENRLPQSVAGQVAQWLQQQAVLIYGTSPPSDPSGS